MEGGTAIPKKKKVYSLWKPSIYLKRGERGEKKESRGSD